MYLQDQDNKFQTISQYSQYNQSSSARLVTVQ